MWVFFFFNINLLLSRFQRDVGLWDNCGLLFKHFQKGGKNIKNFKILRILLYKDFTWYFYLNILLFWYGGKKFNDFRSGDLWGQRDHLFLLKNEQWSFPAVLFFFQSFFFIKRYTWDYFSFYRKLMKNSICLLEYWHVAQYYVFILYHFLIDLWVFVSDKRKVANYDHNLNWSLLNWSVCNVKIQQ